MARHGYLGDDYGSEYDPNYDADDDRGSERGFRGGDDRQRRPSQPRSGSGNFMFDDHNRQRQSRQGSQRSGGGFFARMGEQAGSWMRDDDDGGSRGQRSSGSDHDEWFGGRSSQPQQRYSNHPDAHYHSWRDKQMQSLDRDYQDYCREREQQFHSDFDNWRQNRQGQSGAQAGGQQTSHAQGSANVTGNTGSATSSAQPGTADELLLDRGRAGRSDSTIEPVSSVSGDGGATMGQTPETTRRGGR